MATDEHAISSQNKFHLADEILLNIFSYHLLPSANTIGRERYEDINVPKGPILQNSPIKSYSDNDLHTGACTHQHDEWRMRLQTLSAIIKASRRLHGLALPLLYRIYPGQTIVKPDLFLNTLKARPNVGLLVKEAVIDPWNSINTPKEFIKDFKELMSRSPGFAVLEVLHKTAKTWNDEAHAILLLFYCPNIEALDFTCPAASYKGSATSSLFTQLRRLGPNTLARNNEEAAGNDLTDLPLRKVKTLSLHHAEHHYIRDLDGSAPLMRLFTLQSVTVYRFWRRVDTISNLGHVHDLTLYRCTFEPGELLKGLKRCRELRSLNIIFAGFKATLGRLLAEKDHVDFHELGNVIRTKLTKLRKLRLDDREPDLLEPRKLGSFRDGPSLEELAVNEACLGCYEVDGEQDVATSKLSDMLPPSLRSLVIFRNNQWWHHTDRGPAGNALSQNGVTFHFDGIQKKVVEMLRREQESVPELRAIHMDTPQKFGKAVGKSFGWSCEQVVGDEELVRPSIVTDSLMEPEEKRSWETTQNERAAKPSVLLKRC